MKRSDLYREWARVLDMCEGFSFNPIECVKIIGVVSKVIPTFEADPDLYEFALCVLDGKPVFQKDELYLKSNWSKVIVQGYCNPLGLRVEPAGGAPGSARWMTRNNLVWNAPIKTFQFDARHFPIPAAIMRRGYVVTLDFKTIEQAEDFAADFCACANSKE